MVSTNRASKARAALHGGRGNAPVCARRVFGERSEWWRDGRVAARHITGECGLTTRRGLVFPSSVVLNVGTSSPQNAGVEEQMEGFKRGFSLLGM